jgi:hypothetical protein
LPRLTVDSKIPTIKAHAKAIRRLQRIRLALLPKTSLIHHNLFMVRKNTLSHTVKKGKLGEKRTCQKTTQCSSETNPS